jgi:hypothetical protein
MPEKESGKPVNKSETVSENSDKDNITQIEGVEHKPEPEIEFKKVSSHTHSRPEYRTNENGETANSDNMQFETNVPGRKEQTDRNS